MYSILPFNLLREFVGAASTVATFLSGQLKETKNLDILKKAVTSRFNTYIVASEARDKLLERYLQFMEIVFNHIKTKNLEDVLKPDVLDRILNLQYEYEGKQKGQMGGDYGNFWFTHDDMLHNRK